MINDNDSNDQTYHSAACQIFFCCFCEGKLGGGLGRGMPFIQSTVLLGQWTQKDQYTETPS